MVPLFENARRSTIVHYASEQLRRGFAKDQDETPNRQVPEALAAKLQFQIQSQATFGQWQLQ
jgi:hypothetical protein